MNTLPTPPRWADRFLAWFCRPELLEDLQGDLYEIFEAHCANGQLRKGRLLFGWFVLRSLRYDVIRRPQYKNSNFMMTRNNIKIAFRVLRRDRFNTALSMGGLAIGIACFLLLGFFVKQELTFDAFHEKKDQIFRVWLYEDYGGDKVFINATTPYPFEPFLEQNFSEVASCVQFGLNNYLVGYGQDRTDEEVAVIGPEFFSVFDFPIISGDAQTPLSDQNQVILSAQYAEKYFGQEDPVGQSLGIQLGEEVLDFRVSAVYADMPQNSSFQFDMAISDANNPRITGQRRLESWFNVGVETYILLNEQAQIGSIEERVDGIVRDHLGDAVENVDYLLKFQPLTDIHLNPDVPAGIAPVGNRDYVYILAIISLLVLVIASINYTTLSVGQSLKRSLEVGIRKVMGAFKVSLLQQYLTESVLIAFFALLLGLAMAYLLVPLFNELTQAQVQLGFEPWHLLLYLGLVLVIGITSGLYPAVVLARLRIIAILKGNNQHNRNHYVRKGLMVFQFVVTVFLISSTLIMQRQLGYLRSKDLGFRYDATVAVPLYPDPSENSMAGVFGSAMDKGSLLREQLRTYAEVQDAGLGTHVVGSPGWAQLSFTDQEENFREFRMLMVDSEYLNTFKIPIKEGRAFDPESEADTRTSILLNQAAVDYFGFEDPLGARLPGQDFIDHEVIGVVEDFHFASLHTTVEPLVITQNVMIPMSGISDMNFSSSPIPKLVFRYTGSNLSEVKTILDAEWQKAFPEEDLNFTFVEDNIQQQYASEERMNRLVMVATLLSIIIASLGLLGLTVLVINSRVKEIGIRKVIGASEASIFGMLARSFSWQLLLGIVLSVPITYWLMQDWLSGFAYQINMGVGMFLVSGVISIAVALLVISYHTLRAARVNPVESLRAE
ncbi:MAG: ABC transporter permease [Bacteroidota bacterium]